MEIMAMDNAGSPTADENVVDSNRKSTIESLTQNISDGQRYFSPWAMSADSSARPISDSGNLWVVSG
jgi:hypothetical protein